MYDLKCDEEFNPELPIPDVFSRCLSVSNSTKKNIIILRDQFMDPTFRYRGYNIAQSMENNEKYNVNYFLICELDFLYDSLDKIDMVILQRTLWTFELENFLNTIENLNIKVLYDVDDLIYNSKYIPQYINSVGIYHRVFLTELFAAVSRYYLIAERCDGFIVTTKNLAEHVRNDFNKPVWILHNYYNLEQEKVSNKILKLKENSFSDEKFIIGYFSGSHSHKRDLEISEQALLKLFKKYDDIYLKVVGYMELSPEFDEFKKKRKNHHVRLCSL
jgi:glycosyltransferase involved in cell wall biosynthesis